MALYDPRLLPSSSAFEILVFLALQHEHRESHFERVLPPDWGIDILEQSATDIAAYQCKHYQAPALSTIRRDVTLSLTTACAHRDLVKWTRFVFCFSTDLTAPQAAAVREVARKLGLKKCELVLRGGASFMHTVAKSPLIWDIAVGAAQIGNARAYPSSIKNPISDSRLRLVFRNIRSRGTKEYVSDLLDEQGISRITALQDWFAIALPFYRSTKKILRVMTIDTEIALFWLAKWGGAYLQMNLELIANGVELRRLFVFDFRIQGENPVAFETFIAYASAQEASGFNCRVMPADVFSEELPVECELFCVQDHNNVMLYAPRDFCVTFNREPSLIVDAAEAFDILFHSSAAVAPRSLMKTTRLIPLSK